MASSSIQEKIDSYLSKNIGENNKLALLLDYDGTVAPICAHPDLAILPGETKNILNTISKSDKVFMAMISGRQADNVKKMVGIQNVVYAGSHGFEIIYPDGTRYAHTVPENDKEKLNNVEKALKEQVARDGAWVENKGEVLTFHFRETPEEKRPALIEHARRVIRSFELDPSDALCAIEVQPAIKWHKGYAGEFILKTKFGADWENKVKVIFAGDDVSDEKLIEMFKNRAATFRVSPLENVETSAGLCLPTIEDVRLILKWIEKHYC